MTFKIWMLILVGMFAGSARLGWASCSLNLNCGLCNSGQFNATCMCTDSSSWTCTGCTGTGCPGSPGCCCGHATTPPYSGNCSTASCAGGSQCLSKVILPSGRAPSLIASSLPSMIGLALASLGRVQDVDQTVPGKILSADAPIELDVSPDSNIEISNVKLNITPNAVAGATFTIKNVNDKDLIAYSMVLNLYWDTNPGTPIQMRVTEDGWFLRQYILHPGQSKEGVVRTSLSPTTPMKLIRVVAIPEYVGFSDGSVFGSNVSSLAQKLAASRQSKADLQQTYAGELRAGQSASSVASNIRADQAGTKVHESSRQMGISILLSILNREGPEGLAKRLLEEPTPLPQ